MHRLFLILTLISSCLCGEEPSKPLSEITLDHSGQLLFDDGKLDYRAQAGTFVLKQEDGKEIGAMSYLAYFLKGVPGSERPIAFCFNGGPGAASAWLSLGMAGPKTLSVTDLDFALAPYALENNPSSLLDLMDLVFIDPLGTGLSTEALGAEAKKAYSVQEDADLMAQFIRLFTVKMKRWDSPKYLIGESYGGMRAALSGYRLHDKDGYYLNGMILVAPALDMQTIMCGEGNDLPYALYIPAYFAAAKYHGKIGEEKSEEGARRFAEGRYLQALFAGDLLDPKELQAVAEEMAGWTGLSKELILENNLRVTPIKFRKALLAGEGKCVGRFDARFTGTGFGSADCYSDYDPALEGVYGALTASMNQYMDKEFKWPEVKEYKALVSLPSWDWGRGNSYANCLGELRKLCIQNPKIKLFVAAGAYDLALPAYACSYSLAHASLPQDARKRIRFKTYPSGHMFYFNRKDLVQFKQDIKDFLAK